MTCSKEMGIQHGHTAWPLSKDMLHGYSINKGWRCEYTASTCCRHAAYTCSKEKQNWHAGWSYSIDMFLGHAARTSSMNMLYRHLARTCSIDMEMLQGHAAWTSSMDRQHGQADRQVYGDFSIHNRLFFIYLLCNIFLWLFKYKCVHTICVSYTICVLWINSKNMFLESSQWGYMYFF
jgi:hypothetical protein